MPSLHTYFKKNFKVLKILVKEMATKSSFAGNWFNSC